MSEQDALIDAVLAHPDDDGPRLFYADWCEEQGDSDRAEFIRLQIERAALREYHTRIRPLAERETELLRAHRHEWIVPGLKGRQELARGFVDFLWIRADLLRATVPFVARVPLTRLRVSAADDAVVELSRSPLLPRIRELNLSNNSFVRGEFRLTSLFTPEATDRLRSLVLKNIRLWPEHLEHLLSHPHYPAIESLDLSGNPLGDDGVAVLAQSPASSPLRSLRIRSDQVDISTSINESGAVRLAESKTLRRLRTLDLAGHTISTNGAMTLISAFAELESLNLSFNGIDATVLMEVLKNPETLPRLQYLHLGGNAMHLQALLQWPGFDRGGVLDLRGSGPLDGDHSAWRHWRSRGQILTDDDEALI